MSDKAFFKVWARRFVAVLLAIGSAPISAQGLYDLYIQALNNDPTLQAALRECDAQHAQEDVSRAALLPRVWYQYSNSRNDSRVTQTTDVGNLSSIRKYNSYSSAIHIEQPIFDYAAISGYRQARAESLFADEVLRGRVQELAIRLFDAYIQVIFNRDQVVLAGVQKKNHTEWLALNKRMLSAGEGTRTDVLETQARYDLAIAQEIEATDALDVAVRKLSAIAQVDIDVQRLSPLVGDFPLDALMPSDFAAWQMLALQRNASLASQEHGLTVAQKNIDKSQAGHYPRVVLYGRMGSDKSNSESTYNQRYATNSVGVQLTMPIFSGGGSSASTRQAVAQFDQQRYRRDAQRDAVLVELRKQYNLRHSALAKIRAYELAGESAQQLVVAMRNSMEAGERVNADVLDAEARYLDTLRELDQSRYAFLSADMKLRYTAGTLTHEDIQRMTRYFSSEETVGLRFAPKN